MTARQLQSWVPTESGRSGRGGRSGKVRAGLWGAHTAPPCQPLGEELKGRHVFWEGKLAKGPCDSLGTHRQVGQPWAGGRGQVTPLPAPAPPCCVQTSSQVTEPLPPRPLSAHSSRKPGGINSSCVVLANVSWLWHPKIADVPRPAAVSLAAVRAPNRPMTNTRHSHCLSAVSALAVPRHHLRARTKFRCPGPASGNSM